MQGFTCPTHFFHLREGYKLQSQVLPCQFFLTRQSSSQQKPTQKLESRPLCIAWHCLLESPELQIPFPLVLPSRTPSAASASVSSVGKNSQMHPNAPKPGNTAVLPGGSAERDNRKKKLNQLKIQLQNLSIHSEGVKPVLCVSLTYQQW